MTVVTISRELGSGGTAIAEKVATTLGASCIDKEVLAEMARQSGLSVDLIVEAEERLLSQPRVVSQEMRHLFAAASRNRGDSMDQATYLKQMVSAIRVLAEEGETVFVGRGTQIILQNLPGALHIHIYAPPEVRARRIQKRRGLADLDTASQIIEQADRARREWFRRFFTGVDWKNPSHYHLMIDTGRISEEVAVEMIVRIAQMPQVLE